MIWIFKGKNVIFSTRFGNEFLCLVFDHLKLVSRVQNGKDGRIRGAQWVEFVDFVQF